MVMGQSVNQSINQSILGSGKTSWVENLIKNQDYLLEVPAKRIFFFYTEINPIIQRISELDKVEAIKNFNPDILDGHEGGSANHIMIIVDDHLNFDGIHKELAKLFTVTSRAKFVSLVYLTQALYSKSRGAHAYNRQILLNSNYTALFPNKRDMSEAGAIARAGFLHRYKYFMESYKSATELEHGYLFISSDPTTKKEVELRSRIFFEIEHTILYWERE